MVTVLSDASPEDGSGKIEVLVDGAPIELDEFNRSGLSMPPGLNRLNISDATYDESDGPCITPTLRNDQGVSLPMSIASPGSPLSILEDEHPALADRDEVPSSPELPVLLYSSSTDSSPCSVTPSPISASPSNNSELSSPGQTKAKSCGGDGHIPRPPNMFMFFREEFRRRHATLNQQHLSKIAGEEWGRLSHAERLPYSQMAAKAKEDHHIKYPDYVYRPVLKDQPASKGRGKGKGKGKGTGTGRGKGKVEGETTRHKSSYSPSARETRKAQFKVHRFKRTPTTDARSQPVPSEFASQLNSFLVVGPAYSRGDDHSASQTSVLLPTGPSVLFAPNPQQPETQEIPNEYEPTDLGRFRVPVMRTLSDAPVTRQDFVLDAHSDFAMPSNPLYASQYLNATSNRFPISNPSPHSPCIPSDAAASKLDPLFPNLPPSFEAQAVYENLTHNIFSSSGYVEQPASFFPFPYAQTQPQRNHAAFQSGDLFQSSIGRSAISSSSAFYPYSQLELFNYLHSWDHNSNLGMEFANSGFQLEVDGFIPTTSGTAFVQASSLGPYLSSLQPEDSPQYPNHNTIPEIYEFMNAANSDDSKFLF